MKEESRISRLRIIPLTDWDPMGGGNDWLPDDEYDDYINDILYLLENHCTPEQLEQHLRQIETQTIGLELDSSVTA